MKKIKINWWMVILSLAGAYVIFVGLVLFDVIDISYHKPKAIYNDGQRIGMTK